MAAAYEAFRRGLDPRTVGEIGTGVLGGAKEAVQPGRIAKLMGGQWGPFIGLLLAQLGGSMAVGKHHQLAQMGIQQEALERRGEAMDPQAQYYQAMMPQYEQQEEMSRMALMTTLMGGGKQLAQGQELFGGV